MTKVDYSKISFTPGCVCYNTNNSNRCIVLDGNRGSDGDRSSLVIEEFRSGLRTHTAPNRALIPTGEFVEFASLFARLSNPTPVVSEFNVDTAADQDM